MNKTMFHSIIAAMLVSALVFGQVGAGFLHNKHDAHEVVIDLNSDHPVLLSHGEHCKVCAVDWVSQFVVEVFDFDVVKPAYDFLPPADVATPRDFILVLKSSRAPPVPS
jgi:hypothetical protein